MYGPATQLKLTSTRGIGDPRRGVLEGLQRRFLSTRPKEGRRSGGTSSKTHGRKCDKGGCIGDMGSTLEQPGGK